MFMSRITPVLGLVFVLAACGGGGETLVGGNSTAGSNGSGSGSNSGSGTAGALFSDVVQLSARDRAGMHTYSAQAYDAFLTYNALAPVDRPVAPLATYFGYLTAKMGDASQFMQGELNLQVNYDAGVGSGALDQVAVSGADIINEPPISLDSLAINITEINGSNFGGTMIGVLDDNSGVIGGSYVLDVNADLSGTFVDNTGVEANTLGTGIVGTTTGTVRINGSAPQTLNGAFAGLERQPTLF